MQKIQWDYEVDFAILNGSTTDDEATKAVKLELLREKYMTQILAVEILKSKQRKNHSKVKTDDTPVEEFEEALDNFKTRQMVKWIHKIPYSVTSWRRERLYNPIPDS